MGTSQLGIRHCQPAVGRRVLRVDSYGFPVQTDGLTEARLCKLEDAMVAFQVELIGMEIDLTG